MPISSRARPDTGPPTIHSAVQEAFQPPAKPPFFRSGYLKPIACPPLPKPENHAGPTTIITIIVVSTIIAGKTQFHRKGARLRVYQRHQYGNEAQVSTGPCPGTRTGRRPIAVISRCHRHPHKPGMTGPSGSRRAPYSGARKRRKSRLQVPEEHFAMEHIMKKTNNPAIIYASNAGRPAI